jgi:hypothetical protein
MTEPITDPQTGHKYVTTKDGKVRTPKSTAKDVNERVAACADMLARHFHKHQIKAMLKQKYGVGGRQAETYISRARDYLLSLADEGPRELVANVLASLRTVIRQSDSGMEVIAANAEICKLFGLYKPVKIAPTTPDGSQPYALAERVAQSLTDEQLQSLFLLKQQIDKAQQIEHKPE